MIALLMLCCVGLFMPVVAAEHCRGYLLTGNWYPREKAQLLSLLERLLADTEPAPAGERVRALVSPHAGFSYSGMCAARGYRWLERRDDIRRVILLGSSHRADFYGACVSRFTHNATPLGRVPVNTRITRALSRERHVQVNDAIMSQEHAIENQLPFLQYVLRGREFEVVPVLFGRLDRGDYPAMARLIARHVDDATLVVASSDLNHYGERFGYTPLGSGPGLAARLGDLDRGMIACIAGLNIGDYFDYKRTTGITMCGFVPVGVMMHLFPSGSYQARLVDYRKSGDLNRDYTLSVSYAAIAVLEGSGTVRGLSAAERSTLLKLARATLKHYLRTGTDFEWRGRADELTRNLKRTTGVFVTLKKGHRLRGCIGSLLGSEPLYREVMRNTVRAASADPRFPPVRPEEFGRLQIEISVMTSPRRIDDYRRIQLGSDGVILRRGANQAVYLPQVAAETGWSLDEFLANLCHKAGLPGDAYRDRTTVFFVFQAQVFAESGP